MYFMSCIVFYISVFILVIFKIKLFWNKLGLDVVDLKKYKSFLVSMV